jgi:two-component system phosphate regulon response regulator PhoB
MSSQSAHILVLEDHPTHRNVMTFNLTKAGFTVTTATEAAKALLLATHEHFDLIITDYYLPDYPGTDFVKLLRETDEYKHTPVILLTGRAEELDRQHLAEELLILVLAKPCPMGDLVGTVSKCLELAHSAS